MNEASYEYHNRIPHPRGHVLAFVRFGNYPKDYGYWVPGAWFLSPGDELWVDAAGVKKKAWVSKISGVATGEYKVAIQRAGKHKPEPAEMPEDAKGDTVGDHKTTEAPEINAGDWVLVRQLANPEQFNNAPGFYNFWCQEMNDAMGKAYQVSNVTQTGVWLIGIGFRFPPQMLEPIKVAQHGNYTCDVGDETHTELEEKVSYLDPKQLDLAQLDLSDLEVRIAAALRSVYHHSPKSVFGLGTFYRHHPRWTDPIPKENPVSIKIETITYVNNTPVNDLSDDAVFEIISRTEKEIARLEGISARPARIDKRIAELRAGIDELVKLLDARDKKDGETAAD